MAQTFFILPENPRNALVRTGAMEFVGSLDLAGRWKVSITPAESKRTLDQNAKLWAMLGDLSEQVEWYGRKLTPENWKDMVTAGLKGADVVPGIDGGFVVLGQRTSKMSIKAMAELIEYMNWFGAEKGVQWTEPKSRYAGEDDYQQMARRA